MNADQTLKKLQYDLSFAAPEIWWLHIERRFREYAYQFEECPKCSHPHLDYLEEEPCVSCGCHLTGSIE